MRVAAALTTLLVVQLVSLQLAVAQFESEVDESAPYDVIMKYEGYEERYYPPARWVCHNKSLNRPTMQKMQKSFFPLFFYITGNNKKDMEIPMTAPVSMKMDQDVTSYKWRTQMCFYLPEAQQEAPPTPKDKEVYIEDRPAMTVFVRQVGGFLSTAAQWAYQAMLLKKDLTRDDAPADLTTYYMAGYDSPMKFENRRNEVWFMRV